MASITPKRIYPVAGAVDFMPAGVPTLIYTAPAGTRFVIEKIVVCNTDASARTFQLWIVPDAGSASADNLITSWSLPADAVEPGESFVENRVRVIEPLASLYAEAVSANDLTLFVEGVEIVDAGDASEATITPKQFAHGLVADGGDIVYSPPAGTIGLVHTITLVNIDSIAHDYAIYTEFTASGRMFGGTLAAFAKWTSPPGLHVIPAGAELSASADAAGVLQITVDGAEHVTP